MDEFFRNQILQKINESFEVLMTRIRSFVFTIIYITIT